MQAMPEDAIDGAQLRKSVETISKMDVDILCTSRGPVIRGGAFRFVEKLVEVDSKV